MTVLTPFELLKVRQQTEAANGHHYRVRLHINDAFLYYRTTFYIESMVGHSVYRKEGRLERNGARSSTAIQTSRLICIVSTLDCLPQLPDRYLISISTHALIYFKCVIVMGSGRKVYWI